MLSGVVFDHEMIRVVSVTVEAVCARLPEDVEDLPIPVTM